MQIGGWPIGKNSIDTAVSYCNAILLNYRASETESCLPEEVNFSMDSSSTFSLSTHQRNGIYGGIVSVSLIFVIMRAVLCYLIILAASRSLHSKMLTAILRAPVLFFDTNPVGELSSMTIKLNSYTYVHVYILHA